MCKPLQPFLNRYEQREMVGELLEWMEVPYNTLANSTDPKGILEEWVEPGSRLNIQEDCFEFAEEFYDELVRFLDSKGFQDYLTMFAASNGRRLAYNHWLVNCVYNEVKKDLIAYLTES